MLGCQGNWMVWMAKLEGISLKMTRTWSGGKEVDFAWSVPMLMAVVCQFGFGLNGLWWFVLRKKQHTNRFCQDFLVWVKSSPKVEACHVMGILYFFLKTIHRKNWNLEQGQRSWTFGQSLAPQQKQPLYLIGKNHLSTLHHRRPRAIHPITSRRPCGSLRWILGGLEVSRCVIFPTPDARHH